MAYHPSVGDDRFRDVDGMARLDLNRRQRTGLPEVVLGAGKTDEQVLTLLATLRREDPDHPALATRCTAGVLRSAAAYFDADPVRVDEDARTVIVGELARPVGRIVVVTAGTSDLPVAAECRAALDVLGVGNELLADVGVAGLGRLLAHVETLAAADCVIVVAGMEGTLPSVVAGLVPAPMVAVPTSVGYGVSAGGWVAASAMLGSCSPGVVVVNIDNGFGAAAHAAKIIRRVHDAR